jgi:acetyl-CoA carboxylase biotin carboxyl carrier protein
MKLMNELESEVSGEVVEVLAQNGEPVEFNQPLMRIRPL